MINDKYILVDGRPRVEPDLEAWARWWEDPENRRVDSTEVGLYWVSTVFLGLDHSFGGPVPILFETMVFGCEGAVARYQRRYATMGQAKAGHRKVVERVRAAVAAMVRDN